MDMRTVLICWRSQHNSWQSASGLLMLVTKFQSTNLVSTVRHADKSVSTTTQLSSPQAMNNGVRPNSSRTLTLAPLLIRYLTSVVFALKQTTKLCIILFIYIKMKMFSIQRRLVTYLTFHYLLKTVLYKNQHFK
jgi:hypothetical protein